MACGGPKVVCMKNGFCTTIIDALYTTVRYVIFPLALTKLLPK
jgi:hypothetical protein